jgi:hypothetical protein
MRRLQLLLFCASTLLAACGDEPAQLTREASSGAPSAGLVSAAPGDIFARAATLAAEQGGYRYAFSIGVRGAPELPGDAFALEGTGSVDQRTNRSSLNLDMRALRDTLIASGDTTAAEFDALFGDGNIQVLQDGTTLYIRMPLLAQQGVRTPWVSITAPSGSAPNLEGLGSLGALGGLGGLASPGTPADYLDHLKSVDGATTTVGPEQVRGVATTRYRSALNMAQLLQSAAATPEERAQLEVVLPALGGVTLPYDVWIDGDGLPRRISTTLDFGAFSLGGAGGTGGTTPALVSTYELFDYGTPGGIDLPAPSQVTAIDAATLAGLGF